MRRPLFQAIPGRFAQIGEEELAIFSLGDLVSGGFGQPIELLGFTEIALAGPGARHGFIRERQIEIANLVSFTLAQAQLRVMQGALGRLSSV